MNGYILYLALQFLLSVSDALCIIAMSCYLTSPKCLYYYNIFILPLGFYYDTTLWKLVGMHEWTETFKEENRKKTIFRAVQSITKHQYCGAMGFDHLTSKHHVFYSTCIECKQIAFIYRFVYQFRPNITDRNQAIFKICLVAVICLSRIKSGLPCHLPIFQFKGSLSQDSLIPIKQQVSLSGRKATPAAVLSMDTRWCRWAPCSSGTNTEWLMCCGITDLSCITEYLDLKVATYCIQLAVATPMALTTNTPPM